MSCSSIDHSPCFSSSYSSPLFLRLLQADWVAARTQDLNENGEQGRRLHTHMFQLWLTIARLLSISYGETQASKHVWDEMRELESLRLRRLNHV